MGIFDKIKNALGGDDEPEGIKGPSMLLREAGIDPSGLDFKFMADGVVLVTGFVADEARREAVEKVLAGMPTIKTVDNQLQIGSPPAPEAQPAPAAVPELGPDPEGPKIDPAEAAVESGQSATPGGAVDEALGSVPAADDNTGASPNTHVVESGDTLWAIAEKHYGSGAKYQQIFEANRDILDDPDKIRPGQELKLPKL